MKIPSDISLYPHQEEAVSKMHNGCILCGGVGTGKSRTALYYYGDRVCHWKGGGPSLYIITTARKRDTKDWEKEAEPFGFEPIVDSWNNIQKYADVEDAFFIFDEQRVVGKGAWAKTFVRIAKRNPWILLSATPGDTWMDYVPVFIANGYYKNRTEFIRRHVVYSTRVTKFPKIDRYVETATLLGYRKEIVVNMPFVRSTVAHNEQVLAPFDKDMTKMILSTRWNPFTMEPIKDAAGLCYVLRRAVNSDRRRIDITADLVLDHKKVIVFYNFDYELELLRNMCERLHIQHAEWNGHKHEPIPTDLDSWVYLVQYTAGAEGWNCIETDTIIFYSQNYSYKIMAQAAGRIDRLNTPFVDLYYYHLYSRAGIDMVIKRAIDNKRDFNAGMFVANQK